jgi:hypothetical protein
MHPILNYVEFRTNPKPYVVRGVVHGGVGNVECGMEKANSKIKR